METVKISTSSENFKTSVKIETEKVSIPIATAEKHAVPEISQKENSKSNKIAKIGKDIINFLKIDEMVDWSRGQMQKLGLLDKYDDHFYWNGWYLLRTVFKALWGYKNSGKSNFPEYGPAILVANHQSELDPFLAGSAVQRKVRWVSKKENFDIPLFRSIIKPFGTIALRRGESDVEAMKQIKAVLESGECIGIFPEGTRSVDGSLSKFHKGAARLCLELGVPYVPVAIMGAHKAMPKGKRVWEVKLENKIEIRIGKPVHPEPGMELNAENIQAFTERMQQDVQNLFLHEPDAIESSTSDTVKANANKKASESAERTKKPNSISVTDDLSIS